jgi:signal transduction histidine kinase
MRLWRSRDLLIAAGLAGGALWEALRGPLTGPDFPLSPWAYVSAGVIMIGPVLVRRSHPVTYAIAVTIGTTLLWWVSRGQGELPFDGYTSYMLAAYTLGAHLPRRDAVLAGVLTFAAWGVPDVIDARAGLPSIHQDAGFYVLVGMALAAGGGIRYLRDQSAALQQALADLAAERAAAEAAAAVEERQRIARDMHDVLTHTVSAVAVQAGALRLRLPAGKEAEAVAALESSSRDALRELRHLLGVLRDDDRGLAPPSPNLDDIDQLIAPLAATGIEIVIERTGFPGSVAAGPALAAYRLLQESLTNIGKHAESARLITISLDRDQSSLSVTVTNDGPATSAWHPGIGLTGMRERLSAYGGHVEAGPCPDGRGWSVHGVLPL